MAPNIDAFRHQNFSMERCISNYPLCTPYRGIFMSGRWPYQTGVIRNGAVLSPTEVSLGDTFQSNGYHTGYIGKWHLAGEERNFIPKGPGRLGFEDWHVWDKTNDHYHSWTYNQDTGEKIFPEGWQPTRMTDEAITFLQAQPKDKPWLLVVSWNPPHPPFNPPDEDTAPYPLDKLKFRSNVNLSLMGKQVKGPARPLTSEAGLREAMQGYYGGITGIDKEFARVLKALEDTDQAENTIVVYTSDHGEMMGSQGRMAKQVPFEESCRVPFFVRYPGVTPKGGKSEILFGAIDIYPTLCGLAGIPVPGHCSGRDFSAAMRGRKVVSPELVFLMNEVPKDSAVLNDKGGDQTHGPHAGRKGSTENGTNDREFVNQPSYRGVRTQTHTYAVTRTGRWLLYDNIADPYQMKNLVHDPSQRSMMEKLDAAIMEWMKTTGDPFPYATATQTFSNFPD